MEGVSFPSRIKKKHKMKCCVKNCGRKSNESLDLSFHKFPEPNKRYVAAPNYFNNIEKVDIYVAWKRATKVKKITRSTVVCSRHFQAQDYFFIDAPASRRKLKKIAIPSCNLPLASKSAFERNKKRFERRRKEGTLTEMPTKNQTNQESPGEFYEEADVDEEESMTQSPVEEVDASQHEQRFDEGHAGAEASTTQLGKLDFGMQVTNRDFVPYADFGMQVKSGDFVPQFLDFVTTDQELSSVTGLQSFAVLRCIVEIAGSVYKEKTDNRVKMNLHDKIVMTYFKLKHNVSFTLLAILFKVYTSKHCARVFDEMINLLDSCLRFAVPWPSTEEISRNIPLCFQHYPSIRVVLDCTEFKIQHPKKLCCRIITYSHYKGDHTGKVLTGVTPAGNISFISEVYGGRASDKAIFENSKLINLLEPGDGIMVDKGFLIDDICSANNWNLVRPSFLKNKKQFGKTEALSTSAIAKARVHIERSNERIKKFKIVSTSMPCTLLPVVDQIFRVICATVNLSTPLLADDKFIDN